MLALHCLALLAGADAPKPAFWPVVRAHFSKWDRNADGELQPEEVDARVGDPAAVGPEAAAAVALKRALRGKTAPIPRPVTLASLKELEANPKSPRRPKLEEMFDAGLAKLNATPRELFAGGAAPSLDSVHQGKLGNCFCLAPLGAMLERDSKEVEKLFDKLPNGDYKVTFGSCSVVVRPPTDGEVILTGSSEKSGVWLNLYEKAVGAARNEQKPEEERLASAVDAVARGGSAGTMVEFLTGHKIERFSLKFAKDDATPKAEYDAQMNRIRDGLEKARAERRLLTCGTDGRAAKVPGMTPNHAYAILGYDRTSDRITLWNPHGDGFTPKGPAGVEHGYPRADGRFEMPLAEFAKVFAGGSWELAAGK